MQLDLLQKEVNSAEQDTATVPQKKAKPVNQTPDTTADTEAPEEKSAGAFKTISEAAKFLDVPQHVLRFWESRFGQIKPLKLRGGRRYYRPEDMEILSTIKNLLYKQGYTIKGAKKAFSVRGQIKGNPVLTTTVEAPAVSAKPKTISSKQHSQLAVIRQELIGLRDTLKVYI